MSKLPDPAAEKVARRRERQRLNSKRYRERHPERARESRRKTDGKRRRSPDWQPKTPVKRSKRPKPAARAVKLTGVYARLRERLLNRNTASLPL